MQGDVDALRDECQDPSWASINHGRNMDETWTIHGQLASSLAAQRLPSRFIAQALRR